MVCRSVALEHILFGCRVVLVDVFVADAEGLGFGDRAVDGVASGGEDANIIRGVGPLEGSVEDWIDVNFQLQLGMKRWDWWSILRMSGPSAVVIPSGLPPFCAKFEMRPVERGWKTVAGNQPAIVFSGAISSSQMAWIRAIIVGSFLNVAVQYDCLADIR